MAFVHPAYLKERFTAMTGAEKTFYSSGHGARLMGVSRRLLLFVRSPELTRRSV